MINLMRSDPPVLADPRRRRHGRRHLVGLLFVVGAGALAACSGGGGVSAGLDASAEGGSPTPEARAYVWGYPLVVTRRTLQTFAGLIGVNQLYNQTSPSTASTRLVVSPNVDTLYSVAVLDLRSEPVVLTVPDVTDRYWTYQFIDAWTNSFSYIGTRATAGKGGTFVITPPGWTGALPPGARSLSSPTPVAFLLGRYLFQNAADVANVVALTRTLVPLHVALDSAAPAAPPPLGAAPGTPQQVGTTGGDFYDELGDALALDGPASSYDTTALAGFASLGIGPGLHPFAKAEAADDTATTAAQASGVSAGGSEIAAEAASGAGPGQPWVARLNIGTYTSDVLLRAVIAQVAWGANVPQEAVYALSQSDSAGAAYDGAKSYVVHFATGQLPPYGPLGFWSVTMYGPDHFFVANSANIYAVGNRTQGLALNADGSLDIYVQADAPAGPQANWLPSAASGAFEMILRIYLPSTAVTGGTYTYPTVTAAP
jgi:hypothetical protein